MSLPRLLRRLTIAAVSVVASACSAEDLTVPPEVPLETQVWASGLNVTLSQFTKLSSGVYYRDTTVGTGATLTGTPTVSVYYAGYLPSGSKFDERPSSGQPICFPLTGLIEGWRVGMQGMKIGGTRRLLIPPSLGYGPVANGPIPANANLLFDITLQGVGCQA